MLIATQNLSESIRYKGKTTLQNLNVAIAIVPC